MKKFLLFIVLFVALLSAYPYTKDFNELYDHNWHEVYFHIKKEETSNKYSAHNSYVLIRLNGSGRWVVKKWRAKTVLAFECILYNDYFYCREYTKDCDPILISDYRVSFYCDNFPEKLEVSKHILGIKKAY